MNRVLIIEDDVTARRQLAQLFRFEGFDVVEAESGQSGIATAIHLTPDLIICDIMMPGIDGFGVLQALRQRSGTSLTPFIFLTAKASVQDVRQGMGDGADDYITKPFDADALIASARQRLARRRLEQQEAERSAADTGMSAATAVPCEMESSLAHLERISDVLAATYRTDTQAQHIRDAMQHEVSRLRTLSQRLKLYSELPRMYAQRFSNFADCDETPARCPPELVVEVARSVAVERRRSEDLELSCDSAITPLSRDALNVVVREIVDNAFKFSQPSTAVSVQTSSEPAFWKIAVTDRGCGMLPQQVRAIGAFKQFWTVERPSGLGLGLVLVQTVARLYCGEVLIESEPAAGTRVTVMVPAE